MGIRGMSVQNAEKLKMGEDLAEYIKQTRHFDGLGMGDQDLEQRAKKIQATIDELRKENERLKLIDVCDKQVLIDRLVVLETTIDELGHELNDARSSRLPT